MPTGNLVHELVIVQIRIRAGVLERNVYKPRRRYKFRLENLNVIRRVATIVMCTFAIYRENNIGHEPVLLVSGFMTSACGASWGSEHCREVASNSRFSVFGRFGLSVNQDAPRSDFTLSGQILLSSVNEKNTLGGSLFVLIYVDFASCYLKRVTPPENVNPAQGQFLPIGWQMRSNAQHISRLQWS